MSSLDENTITFGQYKDLPLSRMLKDRKYCSWLLNQDWFLKNYEYLHNRVAEYQPRNYFVPKKPHEIKPQDPHLFLENYQYFHMTPPQDLKIKLNKDEETCYKFYLGIINLLKSRIENGIENSSPNPFDIKAPTSWLKNFEKDTNLSRDIFKQFLASYDLPNIPYIVEDIKKTGGIVYNGAKSFLIAKQKSLTQEKFWEIKLKEYYGEDIGTQYKYKNCFFDFIHIKNNTLYECKLGLKDFNEDQHKKYITTLGVYEMIYLISTDCIVDLGKKIIYTTNPENYEARLTTTKEPNKLEKIISKFQLTKLSSIDDYFKIK
jgi:hypothetical protein